MKDSTAASAGPVLPMPASAPAPEALLRWSTTPEPWLDHLPGGGPRGHEVGAQAVVDGTHQVVHAHVDERGALHVATRDQVERDVE